MQKHNFLLFVLILIIYSCSTQIINKNNREISSLPTIAEVELKNIPLMGEISDRESELSGLCWYGSKLLLLPQYPNRFNEQQGKIFFIEKDVIDRNIKGIDVSPIKPKYFTIDLTNMEHLFSLGSGFEAVTIISDTAYFTIEHLNKGKTESIIVLGIIDTVDYKISLVNNSAVKDPQNLEIHNISDESILAYKNKIIPIYEIFGKNLNFDPKVSVFDKNLNYESYLNFPNIEYRITDVTAADDSGYFWAVNYFYPGDNNKINPAEDIILRKYGIGESHRYLDPIERIIKFRIREKNIEICDVIPIYLQLFNDTGRNWEGIVKYENQGFLLVTDTFPNTILAFAAFQE